MTASISMSFILYNYQLVIIAVITVIAIIALFLYYKRYSNAGLSTCLYFITTVNIMYLLQTVCIIIEENEKYVRDFFEKQLFDSFLSIGIFLSLFFIICSTQKVLCEEKEKNLKLSLITQRKSIGKSVVFSIITFGIYQIYWFYTICKKINIINKNDTYCDSECELYLFAPIYKYYWFYTRSDKLYSNLINHGIQISNNNVVNLLLSMFSLDIVAIALLQNDLNRLADIINENNTNQYTVE